MADYSSILRRKEPAVSSDSNTDEDLLVFGYSCKLFRDDEKALFIDQGKHLIPWMGDEALKIDRYDGRGALSDLKAHEAQAGMSADECFTEAERKVELLCNEERYRALHCNEDEEALYQEEELKRLHRALESKAYGQVAFNYDANSTTTPTSKEASGDGSDATSSTIPGSNEEASGDEPFVPPPDLQLPENMIVPDTNKLNAIIVKTALFIAEQGAQMEIILKTKQSSNPQFAFLSYGTSLHTYYKFLVKKIKQGEWQPDQTNNNPNTNSESSKNIDDDLNDEDDDDDSSYLHPSLDPNNKNSETAPMPWQPPLSTLPLSLYKPSANCSYSMLVNKIKDKQQQQQPATTVSTEMSSIGETQTYVYETQPKEPVVITSGPILYSRHYDDLAARALHFPPRPPTKDEYLILDKMASYVAKNGRDFENVVRSKGDPRFSFLDYRHPHHVYYQQHLVQYELREAQARFNAESDRGTTNGVRKTPLILTCTAPTLATPVTTLATSALPTSTTSSPSIKKKIKPAPVSFSIKKPKEGESVLEKSSALPNEESSEEEDTSNINTTSIIIPPPIIMTTVPIIVTPTLTTTSPSNLSTKAINLDNNLQTNTTTSPTIQIPCEKEKIKPPSPKVEKTSTEVIDLTEDSIDERQRIDEDPNSLTLTSSTTNRQIQLERKRRAAAFLNKIHKEKGLSKNHQTHLDNTNSATKEEEIVAWPSAGSSGNNSPNGADLAERLGLKNGSTISQPKSSISKNSRHSSRRHERNHSSEEESDDPRRKHSKRSRNNDHYHSSSSRKKKLKPPESSFASGSSSGSSSSRLYKHSNSKKNRDRESSRRHGSHSSHSRRRHSSSTSRRKHCVSSSESS